MVEEARKSCYSPQNLRDNQKTNEIYKYYQKIKNKNQEASFLDQRLVSLIEERWKMMDFKS